MLLSSILTLLSAFSTVTLGQDVVGSTGCTAPACVFSNPNLRFGTGTQTSVNDWGLFVQPWYFSRISNTWYKLTFNSYPLDTAIGSGTSGPNWSGNTVVDLYTQTPTNKVTDYSGFIVSSSDTTKTVGHGVIVATRSFTILGQAVIVRNTFSLGANDSFVKITTQVRNNHTTPVTNMMVWVGTRDDYVGTTDVNTKTRGNLIAGNFTAVTANNQSSYAIMITNTNEGVLFYSETLGVMTSYSTCCAFSNAYNANPLSLPPVTVTPTDGSYAAVLPVGNISVGQASSITWYYAAGAVTSLAAVAQSVATAQLIDSGVTPSVTPTSTCTPSLTPSLTSNASITMTSTISPTLMIDAPFIFNTTEIRIVKETAPNTMIFLYVFLPLNLLLLCVCCLGVCVCIRRKREAPPHTPVTLNVREI